MPYFIWFGLLSYIMTIRGENMNLLEKIEEKNDKKMVSFVKLNDSILLAQQKAEDEKVLCEKLELAKKSIDIERVSISEKEIELSSLKNNLAINIALTQDIDTKHELCKKENENMWKDIHTMVDMLKPGTSRIVEKPLMHIIEDFSTVCEDRIVPTHAYPMWSPVDKVSKIRYWTECRNTEPTCVRFKGRLKEILICMGLPFEYSPDTWIDGDRKMHKGWRGATVCILAVIYDICIHLGIDAELMTQVRGRDRNGAIWLSHNTTELTNKDRVHINDHSGIFITLNTNANRFTQLIFCVMDTYKFSQEDLVIDMVKIRD